MRPRRIRRWTDGERKRAICNSCCVDCRVVTQKACMADSSASYAATIGGARSSCWPRWGPEPTSADTNWPPSTSSGGGKTRGWHSLKLADLRDGVLSAGNPRGSAHMREGVKKEGSRAIASSRPPYDNESSHQPAATAGFNARSGVLVWTRGTECTLNATGDSPSHGRGLWRGGVTIGVALHTVS